MKIVVLGAAGQLGGAMLNAATARHEAVGLGRRDVDVTESAALTRTLLAAKPDVVINCSAFSQVDPAEDAPTQALAVNAMAVRTLARVAATLDATLVHYSTDFVFDGDGEGLNTEDREPNPSGVYASSKLIGEWFAADAPRHYVLRVESLFGGTRPMSSVDTLLNGILADREITAFTDRTVSPSYVVDVAAATLQILERRIPYGLYHCVNSGSTTWHQLTRELARLCHKPEALIATARMRDLNMRVRRPLNAALSNEKLRAAGVVMPTWEAALAQHISTRLRQEAR